MHANSKAIQIAHAIITQFIWVKRLNNDKTNNRGESAHISPKFHNYIYKRDTHTFECDYHYWNTNSRNEHQITCLVLCNVLSTRLEFLNRISDIFITSGFLSIFKPSIVCSDRFSTKNVRKTFQKAKVFKPTKHHYILRLFFHPRWIAYRRNSPTIKLFLGKKRHHIDQGSI